MIERELLLPVSPERLWEALTEPESLNEWFGDDVEWDVRPGGEIHSWDDLGDERRGRIGDVEPGRHLRFEWWPEDAPEDVSEVTYTLEPMEDGTRLTVTERALPELTANASTAAHTSPESTADVWTEWDSRASGLWAIAVAMRASA